jgi:hypothetical protein
MIKWLIKTAAISAEFTVAEIVMWTLGCVIWGAIIGGVIINAN